jgi:hypothetical protein
MVLGVKKKGQPGSMKFPGLLQRDFLQTFQV